MIGLKKRLDDAKGRWVEELPHVLWAYWTTPRRSIRETPFSMSYGAEAVIPIETSFLTLRTQSFNPSNNDELLEKELGPYWRKKRKCNGSVSLLLTQTQTGLRHQGKIEITRAWGFGTQKGFGNGKKSSMEEIRTQLGGTLSYHLGGWHMSIFF